MKLVEKTYYLEDMYIYYYITDNICSMCKHNPKNYNPYTRCGGKCDASRESVVECIHFKNINN